jgi:hypothetical protein
LYDEFVESAPPVSFWLIGGIRSCFRAAVLMRRPAGAGVLLNGLLLTRVLLNGLFDPLVDPFLDPFLDPLPDLLSDVLSKRLRVADVRALTAEPD